MHRYSLVFDPSGSFKEGKGTTGWCLMDNEANKIIKHGVLKAKVSPTRYHYWKKHVELIEGLSAFKPMVVIEDYILYADKALEQTNSTMETPQLIGVLKYECDSMGIPYHMQPAVRVKERWKEEILEYKGYLNKRGDYWYLGDYSVVGHIRDAIKHAVHYKYFVYDKEKRRVR